MSEEVYVIIVTAQPENQRNVLKTVSAYVTDEPCRAAELKAEAERVTGGTACINSCPFEHVPDALCWVPMEEKQ